MTLDKRILDIMKRYMGMLVSKKVLTTMEEVEANTNETNLVAAPVVAELNDKLANGRVELVVTDEGLGYKLDGADTVFPFIKSISFTAHWRTQLAKNGADFDHNIGTLRLKVTKNSVTTISGAWPHMGDTYINGTMNTRVWIEKYSDFAIE